MSPHPQPLEPEHGAPHSPEATAAEARPTVASSFAETPSQDRSPAAWSNCSESPALTLVLPEEPAHTDADDEPDQAECQPADTTPAGPPSTALADDDELAAIQLTASEAAAEMHAAGPRVIRTTTRTEPILFAMDDDDDAPQVAAPATEDLSIRPPPREDRPTLAVVPPPSEPERAPAGKPPAPVRIGAGILQAERPKWKPGSPFGDADKDSRFRWELMLTTACGTAACGMAGIWLLRTLLS
jgi:hypothetical protein